MLLVPVALSDIRVWMITLLIITTCTIVDVLVKFATRNFEDFFRHPYKVSAAPPLPVSASALSCCVRFGAGQRPEVSAAETGGRTQEQFPVSEQNG